MGHLDNTYHDITSTNLQWDRHGGAGIGVRKECLNIGLLFTTIERRNNCEKVLTNGVLKDANFP